MVLIFTSSDSYNTEIENYYINPTNFRATKEHTAFKYMIQMREIYSIY